MPAADRPAHADARRRREVRVPGLPEPVSHYTDVVVANGFAFISGMVAIDADGNVVGRDDVLLQARTALEYVGRCLDAVGATPADVCKVTVFVTDMAERARINVARQEFFGATRPASTLVQVAALVRPELRVEIEAVAALR
jgi:enamine deaminase RidA (YjgF/YER057c/UK114 family)